eukprot:1889130-Pyramimonas_sp.AAC.1
MMKTLRLSRPPRFFEHELQRRRARVQRDRERWCSLNPTVRLGNILHEHAGVLCASLEHAGREVARQWGGVFVSVDLGLPLALSGTPWDRLFRRLRTLSLTWSGSWIKKRLLLW